MAQIINSNVASLNAQRNLNTSQTSLNTSLTRLSSGLRINSAKDDAAGLAISERMSSQIRGLNQAVRNANDGISLSQTAEGALGEIGNNLQRIRELAVQSANASNSASDRASLQKEVTQLTSEITRVASQTQFNGLNLLDGSFQSQSFQVGANANQTIDIASILDARSTGLGSHTLTTGGSVVGTVVSGATANGIGQETDLALTTDKGTVGSIAYAADAGADAIASAINDAASGIGVTAKATNSTTLGAISAAGTISFNLTGGTGTAQAISVDITDTNDLSALAAAINGVQNNTGITATFTTAGDKSELTLSTTDGRDIIIDTYDGGAAETIDFGGTTLDDGTALDADAVAVGTVELTSSEGQIIATNAGTDVFAAATDTSSFQSLALTDISSSDGAQTAIEVLDAALSQINTARADLGAIQNRFSSTIANLQSASENLSASRSRIQDADFAAETANMTRGQILQQAGVAILAQANSLPNNVLSLLR